MILGVFNSIISFPITFSLPNQESLHPHILHKLNYLSINPFHCQITVLLIFHTTIFINSDCKIVVLNIWFQFLLSLLQSTRITPFTCHLSRLFAYTSSVNIAFLWNYIIIFRQSFRPSSNCEFSASYVMIPDISFTISFEYVQIILYIPNQRCLPEDYVFSLHSH